jgi:cupin fold WbuC family metalloprotein
MTVWQRSGSDSYYAYVQNQRVSSELIDYLIKQGKTSPTGRARLCLHSNPSDSLHVMLIYHDERTIVPIHRHIPFGEFVIIKNGSFELISYNDDLSLKSITHIGSSGGTDVSCFTPPNQWHTLQFNKPAIFFEISMGALNEKVTEYADLA